MCSVSNISQGSYARQWCVPVGELVSKRFGFGSVPFPCWLKFDVAFSEVQLCRRPPRFLRGPTVCPAVPQAPSGRPICCLQHALQWSRGARTESHCESGGAVSGRDGGDDAGEPPQRVGASDSRHRAFRPAHSAMIATARAAAPSAPGTSIAAGGSSTGGSSDSWSSTGGGGVGCGSSDPWLPAGGSQDWWSPKGGSSD